MNVSNQKDDNKGKIEFIIQNWHHLTKDTKKVLKIMGIEQKKS